MNVLHLFNHRLLLSLKSRVHIIDNILKLFQKCEKLNTLRRTLDYKYIKKVDR